MAAASAFASIPAQADDEAPPPRVDSTANPGPFLDYASRPSVASLPQRACSSRTPVCVHSKPGDGPRALAALDAFDRAWATLTGALDVPAPDVDPDTLAYDVFLGDTTDTKLEARDVRSNVDRGRAFTLLDRRLRASCTLDGEAARQLVRASIFRVAPATEDATARAEAAYLASLAVPCALDVAELAAAQMHPEDAFVDRPSSLFWNRLDWSFGRQPGGLALAALALHPTMTSVPSPRWKNEPDTFDVLRLTFKNALSTGSTVNDLWLDFGIARAFVGANDDGFHVPELKTLGDAGKVPYAWDIPWPVTPRRLTQRVAVAPTGAAYLVVHHAGAKPGARLRVEIQWEEHAFFRWAFVKIDASGRELGRVVIPTGQRATEAQMTLVELDGVDRVLLTGVNTGDPAYPFDPDDEIFEPHGYVVTVAAEE